MTPKKTASITLAELTTRYTKHMEDAGKSRGTVFSYESELRLAQRELGADRSIGALAQEDIARFNACDRVMKLKNGKPKAAPSYLKTQRVLRLALAWAAQTGLIATSPAEPIEEPAAAPKKRAKKDDATASEPAPVEKKPRKRNGAIVLEVAQPDAEAAADAAEAMIAATNPESAA